MSDFPLQWRGRYLYIGGLAVAGYMNESWRNGWPWCVGMHSQGIAGSRDEAKETVEALVVEMLKPGQCKLVANESSASAEDSMTHPMIGAPAP